MSEQSYVHNILVLKDTLCARHFVQTDNAYIVAEGHIVSVTDVLRFDGLTHGGIESDNVLSRLCQSCSGQFLC